MKTQHTPENPNIMDTYILYRWPESQKFMDEPWFKDEAVLADYGSIGEPAAYFIPSERVKLDY